MTLNLIHLLLLSCNYPFLIDYIVLLFINDLTLTLLIVMIDKYFGDEM